MRRPLRVQVGAWLAALALLPAQAADEVTAHVHLTQRGDTLIGLGQRLLAEPARWPELQRLNAIRNPRRMPIGMPIRVPLAWMRVERPPAMVLAASGGAFGQAEPLAPGQTLPEGALIEAGARGQATVQLVDGTVLRLRPGSTLRIETSQRLPAVGLVRSGARLERGAVEVDARPAKGGQPGFRIGTPQGVLGVRGTQFRVSAGEVDTRGEVLEGAVGASGTAAPGAERRVEAGFGTLIDRSGRVAAPTRLLPPPELHDPPVRHERPVVRVRVVPMEGAAQYRVQVARDERFDELLADVRSTTAELRIVGLEDGRWVMRLRVADAGGLEGRDALAVLQIKARPEPPLPRAPASGAVLRGASAGFSWATSAEAKAYRLQLARGSDVSAAAFAAPLRDVDGIQASAIDFDSLAPGAYVWRLASVRADGDQGPFGDASRFELKALPPELPPPPPPAVGDQEVRLHWTGEPGQRFDFQLARDPAFSQLVDDRTLDRAGVELPLPGDGRFYLRLRVRETDGFVGPWTATQHFDVVACVRDERRICVRAGGATLELQR